MNIKFSLESIIIALLCIHPATYVNYINASHGGQKDLLTLNHPMNVQGTGHGKSSHGAPMVLYSFLCKHMYNLIITS